MYSLSLSKWGQKDRKHHIKIKNIELRPLGTSELKEKKDTEKKGAEKTVS